MPKNLTSQLDAIPRKAIAMQGEAHRKPFAEDLPRLIGQAIERALLLSNLSKQEAAWEMGYTDASALSRWISGVETPQFARLFSVMRLRAALVIALAEIAGNVEVETTVRIRRTA